MDLVLLLKAAILGIVEGLTEFLPVSSTGHLIVAASLLDFNDERGKLFEIVIQSGAILAVVWEFRTRIMATFAGAARDRASRRLIVNIGIAFLPLAVLGLLFGKALKANLFNAPTVAAAFIVGGFVILWAERRNHTVRITAVEQMTALDALKVGLAQALALIPGTSRSGATIIGAMVFGFSRKCATEFSFYLGIPTLMGAGAYSVWKERAALHAADLPMFAVGLVFAFFSALLCIRWLIRYVSTHDFTAFAWYRILFGGLVLLTAYFGWVEWKA